MTDPDAPLPKADLGDAFKALAEAVREAYAPLFNLFRAPNSADYYALLSPPPAPKRKPLIHNGRKPRK
ncbi:hypothetical protein SEA_KEALII_53 [Arthrobacter phage KeAlii]|uniref:Uncharacterized protein n=1 Tax=Arthrobacter phage KeAlii TaxID=2885973 RepID=A0AA95B9R3_9CAUD|nr:hypothetical protein PQE15_gp53 [Arthrobacter phage KeAlii]UDL14659.1 hypothetical protein SEA_KEALII_53 [Arthrobacter phage KeAlii]